MWRIITAGISGIIGSIFILLAKVKMLFLILLFMGLEDVSAMYIGAKYGMRIGGVLIIIALSFVLWYLLEKVLPKWKRRKRMAKKKKRKQTKKKKTTKKKTTKRRKRR